MSKYLKPPRQLCFLNTQKCYSIWRQVDHGYSRTILSIRRAKKKKKSPERSFILTKNHSRSATGTGHSAVVHHLVTEPREYRQIITPHDPFPFHPTLRKQPAEGLGLQENLERVDWEAGTTTKTTLEFPQKATVDDQLRTCLYSHLFSLQVSISETLVALSFSDIRC